MNIFRPSAQGEHVRPRWESLDGPQYFWGWAVFALALAVASLLLR